ncbi:hypothetical protein SAMN02745217_02730 [Anaerocolumna xylanovorans DSM 12503]|uniref:Uncharacterized protein n=1 Tax=Anaerocolumna xylanovorans DSM 12503 TaxID=1121345 RepID=A0A1M7YCK3_9FIRM|nr:hypothetical protein SAMN02745217_02730 [Anaerocolumna xylanovorans DSM 12503]
MRIVYKEKVVTRDICPRPFSRRTGAFLFFYKTRAYLIKNEKGQEENEIS